MKADSMQIQLLLRFPVYSGQDLCKLTGNLLLIDFSLFFLDVLSLKRKGGSPYYKDRSRN